MDREAIGKGLGKVFCDRNTRIRVEYYERRIAGGNEFDEFIKRRMDEVGFPTDR